MKDALLCGVVTVLCLGVGCCTLGVVAMMALGIDGSASSRREGGCGQRQVVLEAASPDGAWVARFYHNGCGGGFGTGYNVESVEIMRPGEPPQRVPADGVVFVTDHRVYDQPEPFALRWLNAKKLEITIPDEARAGRLQVTYADLAISYKYLDVDSIGRACQKQWQSLPDEELLRHSLSANDSIGAFFSKCFTKHLNH